MNPYDNNPYASTPSQTTTRRESRSEYQANRSMRQAVNTRLRMFDAALGVIIDRERARVR